MKLRVWRQGLLVLTVLLCAGGVAYATAGRSSVATSVINACQAKKMGLLRVVRQSSACTSKETAISWNVQGRPGTPGPAGPAGAAGQPGPIGASGAAGQPGRPGADGAPGVQGVKGDQGSPGPKGDPGPQGATGLTGLKGDTGLPGVKGDTGLPGPKGDPGPQGATGLPGAAGATGLPGPKGDPGPAGAPGPAGIPGPPGPAGASGGLSDAYIFHQAGAFLSTSAWVTVVQGTVPAGSYVVSAKVGFTDGSDSVVYCDLKQGDQIWDTGRESTTQGQQATIAMQGYASLTGARQLSVLCDSVNGAPSARDAYITAIPVDHLHVVEGP
jgi:collagen triple helix repeat protein